MTFGWSIDAAIRDSRTNLRRIAMSCISEGAITLRATVRSSERCRARYTTPMPPRPATAWISWPAKTLPGAMSPITAVYIGREASRSTLHPSTDAPRLGCAAPQVRLRAGDQGIEPQSAVLETAVVTIRPVPRVPREADGTGSLERSATDFRPHRQRTCVRVVPPTRSPLVQLLARHVPRRRVLDGPGALQATRHRAGCRLPRRHRRVLGSN